MKLQGPGGHLYFRLDIILVKGLSKHTINTYFLGMKIDPKYAFLHAFFSICLPYTFQNLSIWPKNTPFFPILHVFAPRNDVRTYIVWSWKATLITWIFLRGWYPTSNTSDPLGSKAKGTSISNSSLALDLHGGNLNRFLGFFNQFYQLFTYFQKNQCAGGKFKVLTLCRAGVYLIVLVKRSTGQVIGTSYQP